MFNAKCQLFLQDSDFMFCYQDFIHLYSPRVRADITRGTKLIVITSKHLMQASEKSLSALILSGSFVFSLRKHAYSNILRILRPKNENFQMKISHIFLISAQNIHCGYSLEPPRRGGSNEYPQSMILSRNKKNNIYPCKPQFYYIKVGFKGVKII